MRVIQVSDPPPASPPPPATINHRIFVFSIAVRTVLSIQMDSIEIDRKWQSRAMVCNVHYAAACCTLSVHGLWAFDWSINFNFSLKITSGLKCTLKADFPYLKSVNNGRKREGEKSERQCRYGRRQTTGKRCMSTF